MYFGTPEEWMEHVEAQQDRAQMEQQDAVHEVQRFFENLSLDDAKTLRMIFSNIVTNPVGAQVVASHWQGVVAGILAKKFNICLYCQLNHDEQREEALAQTEEEERMRLYLLERVEGVLRCSNCKTPYTNLEDRMLRAPGKEGCQGCKMKERWG
jgi:hypothetical protein